MRTQVDFPRAIVLRLAAHRDQLDDQGAIVKESNSLTCLANIELGAKPKLGAKTILK